MRRGPLWFPEDLVVHTFNPRISVSSRTAWSTEGYLTTNHLEKVLAFSKAGFHPSHREVFGLCDMPVTPEPLTAPGEQLPPGESQSLTNSTQGSELCWGRTTRLGLRGTDRLVQGTGFCFVLRQDQRGLKLLILLPQSPESWPGRCVPTSRAGNQDGAPDRGPWMVSLGFWKQNPTGFSYQVASGDNRRLRHEDNCGRDRWTSIILLFLKGLKSFPQPWETNGGCLLHPPPLPRQPHLHPRHGSPRPPPSRQPTTTPSTATHHPFEITSTH